MKWKILPSSEMSSISNIMPKKYSILAYIHPLCLSANSWFDAMHAWFFRPNYAFKATFISTQFSVFSIVCPTTNYSTWFLQQSFIVLVKNITPMFTLASTNLPSIWSKYCLMCQKKNSKPLSVVCVVIWFWILDFDSHYYSLTTKLNPFSDWLISTSIVSTLSPCLHSEVIIFSTIFSNLLSWSFILGLLGSFSFVTTFFMWVFHGQPPEHPKNSLIYDLIQIIHGSMTQFFACLVKHPIM